MAYTVDVLVEHKTLALRLFGAVSIEDRAAGLVDGLSKLQATGFKRILVDLRHGVMQPAALESCNRHAANLAATASHLPDDVRIAYIYDVLGSKSTPVEMLAAARGYYFESFTNIDSAMGWLHGHVPELDG
ncbi:MAG: hypothetical protein JWL98_1029 [Xanthomonadaceae bacterium]|nr:hypothetical protein [Xanthomonadaceae bacterium]